MKSNTLSIILFTRNIFLDENNVIKLGDFGLARLLVSSKISSFIGTEAYMSPEQFKCLHECSSFTAKTDIWFFNYTALYLKKSFLYSPI